VRCYGTKGAATPWQSDCIALVSKPGGLFLGALNSCTCICLVAMSSLLSLAEIVY
jgi:hypothetical protein